LTYKNEVSKLQNFPWHYVFPFFTFMKDLRVIEDLDFLEATLTVKFGWYVFDCTVSATL